MIKKITEETLIPLFGLDFLGIIDRGTNVLEVKTHTLCQFRCKYCFVNAGDYTTNFTLDYKYLLKWIQFAIDKKKSDDIEIHLAPYGEIFLYKQLYELIEGLNAIPQITQISIQTNGTLITHEIITKLEQLNVKRLNISLNSMNPKQCKDLCGVAHYDLKHLLSIFDLLLDSSIDLLIAPVWFFGVNDKGILDILEYVKNKAELGYTWPKLRLGIQNYLEYKTGRKLKKVYPREFKFFYDKLKELEKTYNLKLKLGPSDFNINKCKGIFPPVKLGEHTQVQIIEKGRFENEYIGALNKDWAVKVIVTNPYKKIQINDIIEVEYIRGNLKGNLLTAIYK